MIKRNCSCQLNRSHQMKRSYPSTSIQWQGLSVCVSLHRVSSRRCDDAIWRCVRWTLAHLLRINATPSDANHWPLPTSYANEGSGKLAMVKPWCRYDVTRWRWHGGGALLDADSYFCRRRGSYRKSRRRSRSRRARRGWKWVADARVASFLARFNVERCEFQRRFHLQSYNTRAACLKGQVNP